MSRFFISLIVFVVLNAARADEASLEHWNLGKGNLAVSGYDVVSYFSPSGPLEGSKSIALEREGVTYRFASEANRQLFEANPQKYVPAFGGWCAWAMLEGGKTKIDPKSYKIYEGQLFLFYDGIWGDTLRLWNEKAQAEPEAQLARLASRKWAEILGK